MMPVRVLLADDHTLVRAGLRKLLESIPDFEVVGEAGDGLALLELANKLQPHLVLMDIAMPGLNGLEATARLAKAQPQIRVLILSMHQNEEYVRQALRHGAAAYLLKDAAPVELELALAAVMRGETYLSAAVQRRDARLRAASARARAAWRAVVTTSARSAATDCRRSQHQGDRAPAGPGCQNR